MPALPPTWAIVLGILTLLFGGTGGIIWVVRRDIRESRQMPITIENQRLENERVTNEIAAMLRQAQVEAVAEMRVLLKEAREGWAAAREEVTELRAEMSSMRHAQTLFRTRVENLLRDRGIDVPDWWHQG